MYKNSEGCPDPTVGEALKNIQREETAERMTDLIHVIKKTAELAGFEVVGRITLKDRATGLIKEG